MTDQAPTTPDTVVVPSNEAHIKAVAEAMFDHEPRNGSKRFREASVETQYRYIDKAAWVLSQASKTLAALSRPAPVADWRPMNEAPTDGTKIIARNINGEVFRCWWHHFETDDVMDWQDDADSEQTPIGWMTYPGMAAPVAGEGDWPALSADLAQQEGFESVDMLVDKARIGVALMEALPEGYSDCNCPSEIICDLINERDDALQIATPTPEPAAARGGEVTTLRTLLDNLVIAQSLSRELRQHATDQARSYLYQTRPALSAKGGS